VTGRRSVRLGVDGPIRLDTAAFADAVARALVERAVPVARVSTSDFMRARSIRLERGRDDPDACYDLWYDFPALRREVLDPLGPGGNGSWLPRLRDPVTDRSVRAERQAAPPGTVAVVDGRFLRRDDVRPAFDLIVHLSVSAAARRRRLPPEEAAAVLGAWDRYLAEYPPDTADLVIGFDHPDRPARRGGRAAITDRLSARPR
jgi:hypothetical protein